VGQSAKLAPPALVQPGGAFYTVPAFPFRSSTPTLSTDRRMERTHFIEHQGRRILLLDYSGIRDAAEALREIQRSREIVARQPAGSVLVLTHVKDARYNTEVVQALKALVEHNRPYVKASAVVGLGGIQQAIYRTILLFSRRVLKTFDDLEAAKDWLVVQ